MLNAYDHLGFGRVQGDDPGTMARNLHFSAAMRRQAELCEENEKQTNRLFALAGEGEQLHGHMKETERWLRNLSHIIQQEGEEC